MVASAWDGIPLPELPPRLHNSSTISGAYPQILELERELQAAYSREPSDDGGKKLMYARILGYLILEGPSDEARIAVGLEVHACNGEGKEEKLLAIGQFYFDHFIRAFRMNRGRTLASSDHASPRPWPRPFFDTRRAMIMAMVVEAPQNHQQAEANALVRDGFRCAISGYYDFNSVENNKELKLELELELERAGNVGVCLTECAHIFPELTNANVSGGNVEANKLHYAASVWTVLERFGNKKAVKELNGSGIHRLQNVLTLNPNVHLFFDRLKMWLEPVGGNIPNTYKLCATFSLLLNGLKNTVTFTTPDPENLPVPSETYLGLHAACCRVANLSGAGDYIEKILRDMEEIQVLSQDGTSAEVLHYALWPLSQEISVL